VDIAIFLYKFQYINLKTIAFLLMIFP